MAAALFLGTGSFFHGLFLSQNSSTGREWSKVREKKRDDVEQIHHVATFLVVVSDDDDDDQESWMNGSSICELGTSKKKTQDTDRMSDLWVVVLY